MKSIIISILIILFYIGAVLGSSYNESIKLPSIVGAGNTGISFGEGLTSLYNNPAGLADITYSEVSGSYTFLYSESLIRYNTLGYYFKDNGDGGIGIGLVSSGLNGSFSDSSENFFRNYNENIIYFGYGFNIYNGLSLGVKIKTFMVTTAASALGWGVDVGFLYNIYNIVRLNFLVKNLGKSEIKWTTGNTDIYEVEYDFGGLIEIIPGVKFGMDILSFNNENIRFNTGLEVWFIKMIGIRTGIYRNLNKNYVYTFGSSIVYNDIFFEYGIEIYNEISSSQTIGIDYKF